MKKVIPTFLFLLLFYVLTFAQNSRTLTIGIIDGKPMSERDTLLSQLKGEITAVLGQGVSVHFNEVLYNDHDIRVAKDNYARLLNNDVDIIVAFGVVNSLMFSQEAQVEKPTILVGAINDDFYTIPEDQETSDINNLAYVATPFSYSEDLDTFAALYTFEHVGIVVDDYLLNLLPLEELLDTYFSNKTSTYELITLTAQTNTEGLFSNVDAAYIVSHSNLVDDGLDDLIAAVNDRGIPSFSALGVRDVEQGVLLTNQPKVNIDQIFRRVALNVESIFNGVNAGDLPLRVAYKKQLSINMSTVDQINFPLKYSMLGALNLIEGSNQLVPEQAYSLTDLMHGVIDRNLSLDAGKMDIDLAEQEVLFSKSKFLPDVGVNVLGTLLDPKLAEISNGANPQLATGGSLDLQQLIYSESARANIDIQRHLLSAQKEDFNGKELDALLDASAAYFNALILKTRVQLQIENLGLTKKNLEIAEQKFELGASGRSDVLRFKSEVAQNTQAMIEAKNALEKGYQMINALLNHPISEEIDIRDTNLDEGTEEATYDFLVEALDDPGMRDALTAFLVEEAKINAPELKNLDFNVEAILRKYRLYDTGRYIPTVALQGQYNYAFSASGKGSTLPIGAPVVPDGHYNVGVNVSLPIFQQNTRNIDRQISKIQADQLYVQRENTNLNIEKNISNIVLDLVNETARIEISAINEDYSQQSLELSQTEYLNGAIPVIQLIDAQNNYLKAQLDNATARYNYFLVSMQLERAMGYFFLMNTDASNQQFGDRARQYLLNNN